MRSLLAALAFAIGGASCSSDDAGAPGPASDIVLKPNVRVLDAASLARIESVLPDGTIVFADRDPTLDTLAAGDIVAGGVAKATPNGLLRRVLRAERASSRLVLVTAPAQLTDAIESGRVHWVRPLTPPDLAPASVVKGTSATGFYAGFDDLVLYDGGSVGARVTASGTVSVEPTLDFDLDIGAGGVKKLEFTIGGTQAATIDLTGGAGVQMEEREDVASYTFVPIVIQAGPLPLVFLPRLVLEVGAKARFDAKTTVSIVEQSSAKVGLRYEGGSLSPIASADPSLSFGTPKVTAGVEARAWAGARGELMLYGELGPYGTLEGYLRFDAATNKTPCWSLAAGVAARFGFKANFLGIEIVDTNVPVLDASKPLATGDCEEPLVPPPPPWAYAYERVGYDGVLAVDAMGDGGLVVGLDLGGDAGVTRLAPDGAIVWQRRYSVGARANAVRARGDFVFVGGSAWVAKLDAKTGDVVWSNTYGKDVEVRAIDATADGGCVVVGLAPGAATIFDYWFAKLTANGDVTWSNVMGDAKWEQVNAVRALAGGGYALAGQYAVNQNADAFFARVDDTGKVTLQKRYAGNGTFESFDAVLPTTDGGFVLIGRAQRPTGGSGWAVKTDANGTVVWSKSFGETGNDYLYGVAEVGTGFLATGRTSINPSRAWAVALDPSGHPIWSRAYGAGGGKSVEGRGLALLADGSFSFAATTNAFVDTDMMALHVSYDGQIGFAPGSGMAIATLSGTSEAPYAAPGVTTTTAVAAYPIVKAAMPVVPVALLATPKKLSQ